LRIQQCRRVASVGGWLCLLVILIASFLPPSEVESLGSSDELGHFLAYAALSVCWISAGEVSLRRTIVVFAACVALGAAVEVLQPLFQRHGGWLDAGANAAGALIGTALGWLSHRLIAQDR
jgi:VanZ family protein